MALETTAVVAAVVTGLRAWIVLAVSIVVLWVAMYYPVARLPQRHGEQSDVDSVEGSVAE
jgi:hypothetical protein